MNEECVKKENFYCQIYLANVKPRANFEIPRTTHKGQLLINTYSSLEYLKIIYLK